LIKAIWALVKRVWAVRFLRFLIIGGVNAAFGYSIFALFILLGLHYVFASLLGQICGILFNFKTTGEIVFKNRNNRLLFKFIGVYFITYLVNIGLLKLFAVIGVSSLAAGAIIIIPVALLSYYLSKRYVFKTANKQINRQCYGSVRKIEKI
jgi:putative flippase GtrA